MISVAEALARVHACSVPLPAREMALIHSAGHALAQPVRAVRPLPPWDNSSMDGYAVRSQDLAGAGEQTPTALEVAFAVHAGDLPEHPVPSGSCARIMTGAPMPDGADAVVMQERTVVASPGNELQRKVVAFLHAPEPGESIRRRGSDVAEGVELLPAGSSLGAGEIGLLASQGIGRVRVHRRPRVAVLATGDELCELHEDPGPGRIVASSTYALAAAIADAGAEPVLLGIARDDLADTRAKIEAGLESDVLLTTGGVSVGDRDLVKEVLTAAGCREQFWQVAIKPGKPIYFATAPTGGLVFGLPGNPISTLVTFEIFVRPALRRLAGHANAGDRPVLAARLDGALTKKAGRAEYVRAAVRLEEGGLVVSPLQQQSSGALTSYVGVGAFILFPVDATRLEAGSRVEALLLGTDRLGSATPVPRAGSEAGS